MELETLTPVAEWTGNVDEIAVLGTDGLVFKIWGGDWCIDCKQQLPAFAAALEAVGVSEESIEHYPVDKSDDGSKSGPGVEAYEIERIPTVVVEQDGTEVVRFVETESQPIAEYLAGQLQSKITA